MTVKSQLTHYLTHLFYSKENLLIMAINMKSVRENLQNQQRKASETPKTTDNALYKFYDMPIGQEAVIRFLPDGNEENTTSFWVERQVIKLPFAGILGGDDKEVIVQVPCVDMYGDRSLRCPITAEISPWWKTKSNNMELDALARKYYKKKTYVFQGFVIKSPFEEQNLPENPIRRFNITPQVYEPIRSSLLDPDMENLPIDYVGGRDFKVKKTQKGEYADYSTSSWSMVSRDLSQRELEAIETHGLFNLSDFIPKKPTQTELNIIVEMFHDSVNGLPYDPSKYQDFYKPWNLNTTEETTVQPEQKVVNMASKTPSKPVQAEVQPQAVSASTDEAKSKADDILARLRKGNS
jgi:hypothetical protein